MDNNKISKCDKNFYLKLSILIILILTPFILFHNSLYVITSPSMAPALNVGDIVIRGDKDASDIKVGEKNGDILILKGPQFFYENGFDPIFWNYLEENTPIIHRAIDKKKIGDTWYFLTKGDNNLVPDGAYRFLVKKDNYVLIEYDHSKLIYIPETEILGVVIISVPFIGYINMFFPIICSILIGALLSYLIIKRLNYEIKIVKIK